ncbi:cation diffusion facilitator family transporter [Metallosphaera cuprina]|nr:cation diffusion facilitator family transporter [Metallosphaera cuprina]
MRGLLGFWSITAFLLIMSVLGKSATLTSEAIHSILDALVVTLTLRASNLLDRRDNLYTYSMHRLEAIYSVLNIIVVIIGIAVGVIISLVFLILGLSDNPLILTISSFVAFIFALISSTERGDALKEAVSLHAILDSLTYLAGFVIGILISLSGIKVLDPIGSFVVLAFVLITSLPNIKESYYTLMERSPIDVREVQSSLSPFFATVHHIHVWSICPHERVATLHILENSNTTIGEIEEKRKEVERILKDKFSITHVTVQFETKREENTN